MATQPFNTSVLRAKTLCSQQLSATTATTVYTTPSAGCAKIGSGTVCNTSAASVNVTVAVVPSGSTDDGTHTVIYKYPLAAGDTLPLTPLAGFMLGASDFVSVTASTANVIDVVISGTEGLAS